MSNLTHKNRYTGKRDGPSFERAGRSHTLVRRAEVNLEHASDPAWVRRGGWSEAQVRRIIREATVILGRQRQRELNRHADHTTSAIINKPPRSPQP